MPGGRDDRLACLGPIPTRGHDAWRGRGSGHWVHGGGRGCWALGRREPARPRRRPAGRHDSRPRPHDARWWAGDGRGVVAGTVSGSAGRRGGQPDRRRIPRVGGGAGVPVLRLVCLCLGVLWLWPRPVAAAVGAAPAPGLAVLSAVARAARWGWFAALAGVWAWLRISCLPSWAVQAWSGCCPGSLYRSVLTRHTTGFLIVIDRRDGEALVLPAGSYGPARRSGCRRGAGRGESGGSLWAE